MKTTIFSENEVKYLENREEMEKKYEKNYIYQIRHSIKKKLENFIYNDLKLLIDTENILDDKLIESIILKIAEKHLEVIKKVLKL